MYVKARDEDWTRDLILTKDVLYHWATRAGYFIKVILARFAIMFVISFVPKMILEYFYLFYLG